MDGCPRVFHITPTQQMCASALIIASRAALSKKNPCISTEQTLKQYYSGRHYDDD